MNSEIKTTVVLFGIVEKSSNNYRKLSKKILSVLLLKNDDKYSLPCFISDKPILLDDQAYLAIENLTGLKDIYVEQLYTFSNVVDDCLCVNSSFLGLISRKQMYKGLKENCYWCDFEICEKKDGYDCKIINMEDSFSFSVSKKLKEHTTDRYKFYENDNGKLIKDISIILVSAFERLRNKVNYTDIVFNMMDNEFTLKELQQVYEAILNKKLLDAAFRRIIFNKVEETDDVLKGIGCRPSKIYKYREKNV